MSEREEELTVAKDEARKCRTELEHAKLAMSEMEAVDKEVQALKQQVNYFIDASQCTNPHPPKHQERLSHWY